MLIKGENKVIYNSYKGKKSSKYGIIALVLLFFIITTLYLLLYTDFFNIEEIEIKNLNALDQKELLKISNLKKGQNIFKLNKSEIEKQVRRHPMIKDATLKRKIPNKVIMTIVERKVISIVPLENGDFIFVDPEGVAINKSSTLTTYNIPLITGLENVSFIMGDSINISPNSLKETLLEIIRDINKNNLLSKISEIHVLENNDIQIYTNNSSIINLGKGNVFKEKLSFIKYFISSTNSNIIVDISHGGDPVYKPRID